MSLTDGTGLSATDIMALTGNNDGFGSGFGGGWWVILFILLLGGGFWGGNGWGGNGNLGNGMLASGVQQGFDQSAVMTALSNLNTAVSNGFAAASVDSCNKAMANMQAINGVQASLNAGQNAILMQMGNYEMARQQCCCDAKLQLAQTQATMLAEHCSDRSAIAEAMNDIETKMAAGFQSVHDVLAQNKYDALKEKYDAAVLAASQSAQTAALVANNQYQTDQIMNFLNPPYARVYPPASGTTTTGA